MPSAREISGLIAIMPGIRLAETGICRGQVSTEVISRLLRSIRELLAAQESAASDR